MKNLFLISFCLCALSSYSKAEANSAVFTTTIVRWQEWIVEIRLAGYCDEPLDAPICIPYTVSFMNSSGDCFATQNYYPAIPAGVSKLTFDHMKSDSELVQEFKDTNPRYANTVIMGVEVEFHPYEYSGSMNITGLDY